MKLLTEVSLNSFNSNQLRAEYKQLSEAAFHLEMRNQDNDYVVSQVEKLVEEFSLKNFKKSGKGPKKFLFWVILNADEVYNLVVTIINLIKTLKKKYNDDGKFITLASAKAMDNFSSGLETVWLSNRNVDTTVNDQMNEVLPQESKG